MGSSPEKYSSLEEQAAAAPEVKPATKITKRMELILTDEEINSPEDIEIVLTVKDNHESSVDYTITYPKTKKEA